MKQALFTVTSNTELAPSVLRMTLAGDTSAVTAAGQFVNIKIDGCYLRRPISVCDYADGTLSLIYKVVGTGTEKMRAMPQGTVLDLLVGLGNGYDTSPAGDAPLLVGGGVGVPPLYALCRKLIAQGARPQVILGFNRAEEVFCEDEFRALGADVTVTTADGSYGTRGFVTDAMREREYTYIYTCGPLPMLRAVDGTARAGVGGQFSFEERMGCGFGACMGCTCETKYGAKRICRDGPVLFREEIIW